MSPQHAGKSAPTVITTMSGARVTVPDVDGQIAALHAAAGLLNRIRGGNIALYLTFHPTDGTTVPRVSALVTSVDVYADSEARDANNLSGLRLLSHLLDAPLRFSGYDMSGRFLQITTTIDGVPVDIIAMIESVRVQAHARELVSAVAR
ncbi:hypothetical protein Ga0074812_11544 [Parafrankia irregularis]|uniref:Sensory transduction regulator n=1 Tax=Parafrankia irregularis TaxID=795642 RepID=A0A0S4QS53_9ACTN|nr:MULTISPECIES: hypothetical protein [Parafrankia]MBE3202658.1 hypothetical protein [Parafrankia sp. CH37]CUU57842.1 hypothetical protein Ga0074812_11544 [Parafrankia irregularis]